MSDYETTEEIRTALADVYSTSEKAAAIIGHDTGARHVLALLRDYARSEAEIERLRAALRDVRETLVIYYMSLPTDKSPGPPTSVVKFIDAAIAGKGET